MNLDIFQIDAFTSEPFGGNPAAVVPLKEWLPDATMQSIALENNLSETAYFVKEGDKYHIRWFTPAVEVALCGHATLASAYVLFEVLKAADTSITFLSKSGELRVDREGDRLVLDFPAIFPDRIGSADAVVAALGSQPTEIYKGMDYMLIFDTEETIAALDPDFHALYATDARGVIATAPGTSVDFVSRFFAPGSGIDEDPVTGSSHCALTPYWAKRLGKNRLTARQISARGGDLFCEFAGERVKIGGQATLYLKGQIFVGESLADAAAN
jgi:PhzF family phenazine biosynthesis protein